MWRQAELASGAAGMCVLNGTSVVAAAMELQGDVNSSAFTPAMQLAFKRAVAGSMGVGRGQVQISRLEDVPTVVGGSDRHLSADEADQAAPASLRVHFSCTVVATAAVESALALHDAVATGALALSLQEELVVAQAESGGRLAVQLSLSMRTPPTIETEDPLSTVDLQDVIAEREEQAAIAAAASSKAGSESTGVPSSGLLILAVVVVGLGLLPGLIWRMGWCRVGNRNNKRTKVYMEKDAMSTGTVVHCKRVLKSEVRAPEARPTKRAGATDRHHSASFKGKLERLPRVEPGASSEAAAGSAMSPTAAAALDGTAAGRKLRDSMKQSKSRLM
jgi:hypothetical protein